MSDSIERYQYDYDSEPDENGEYDFEVVWRNLRRERQEKRIRQILLDNPATEKTIVDIFIRENAEMYKEVYKALPEKRNDTYLKAGILETLQWLMSKGVICINDSHYCLTT